VDVTLTATVSATDSSVGAGSVSFQVKNGDHQRGSAVVDTTVVAGAASCDLQPAGRDRGG
jgi:hypothetical protein